LLKGLSKEQSEVFDKYDEINGRYEAFIIQVLYELGFVDGIRIATRTDEDLVNMYPIFKQVL